MKTLYVVRHAKASWDNKFLTDYERPLTDTGIQDANSIGEYFNTKKYIPEYVLSSSAKRTTQTADILIQKISKKNIKILTDKSLYGASVDETLNILHAFDNTINQLMIVGHNPTTTMIINEISDSKIDHVPTTGVAIIKFDIEKWADLKNQGMLIEFIFPKKLCKLTGNEN